MGDMDYGGNGSRSKKQKMTRRIPHLSYNLPQLGDWYSIVFHECKDFPSMFTRLSISFFPMGFCVGVGLSDVFIDRENSTGNF